MSFYLALSKKRTGATVDLKHCKMLLLLLQFTLFCSCWDGKNISAVSKSEREENYCEVQCISLLHLKVFSEVLGFAV